MKFMRKPTIPVEVDAVQLPEGIAIFEASVKVGEGQGYNISGFGGDYLIIDNGVIRCITQDVFNEEYVPLAQATTLPTTLLLPPTVENAAMQPPTDTSMGMGTIGNRPKYVPQ